MATVVGGAGYGLWVLADRYIKPLVAPPTPPQIEQDKAAIDEQFNKAFALLDTLSTDTTALKEAEEQRTKRLDSTISDIESIVSELKSANQRREDDSRRLETEIKTMKDSLPHSIDNVRDASERQLKELSTELASLKQLMGNRMGANFSSVTANIPKTQPATYPSAQAHTQAQPATTVPVSNQPSAVSTPTTETAPGSSANPTGVNGAGKHPSFTMPSSTAPRPSSSTFGNASNKAAIPAWQMAAQNKQKDFNIAPTPVANGLNQPTVTSPGADGAEAVAALGAS